MCLIRDRNCLSSATTWAFDYSSCLVFCVVLYCFVSVLCLVFPMLLTRLTRRVPLVEQELLTLLEHLSAPTVFSGVRVTRSLVLYVCFVDRCLSFCTFSFGHCVVCSSSIYGFWLPLWYLQTLLVYVSELYMLDCSFGFFYCLFISIHVYDMQMRILDCGLFLACLTGWLNFRNIYNHHTESLQGIPSQFPFYSH